MPLERMPGETDAGWFQRLANHERAAAHQWRALGETAFGDACDQLAVVYQRTCEMYQHTQE